MEGGRERSNAVIETKYCECDSEAFILPLLRSGGVGPQSFQAADWQDEL